MNDKYDDQIAYLTEHPEKIGVAWFNGEGLFKIASLGASCSSDCYGCLTMIRNKEKWQAFTPELTAAIRADERLPKTDREIRVEHLPIFAYWQRILDVERKRLGGSSDE